MKLFFMCIEIDVSICIAYSDLQSDQNKACTYSDASTKTTCQYPRSPQF